MIRGTPRSPSVVEVPFRDSRRGGGRNGAATRLRVAGPIGLCQGRRADCSALVLQQLRRPALVTSSSCGVGATGAVLAYLLGRARGASAMWWSGTGAAVRGLGQVWRLLALSPWGRSGWFGSLARLKPRAPCRAREGQLWRRLMGNRRMDSDTVFGARAGQGNQAAIAFLRRLAGSMACCRGREASVRRRRAPRVDLRAPPTVLRGRGAPSRRRARPAWSSARR